MTQQPAAVWASDLTNNNSVGLADNVQMIIVTVESTVSSQ